MIYIIGLGPNNSSNIKENIKKLLLNNTSAKIIARMKEHPAISFLEDNNITFETCDKFYTNSDNFENTYNNIANYILKNAENSDVLYLVPGHPMVAELTTQLLISSNREVKIIGGESFLDSCFNAARFDPVEGFMLADATAPETLRTVNPHYHLLITQCYDDITAANISTELMEIYPYDYEVKIIEQAGADDEKIYTSTLNELSATVGEKVNNLRAIYIAPLENALSYNLKDYTSEYNDEIDLPEDKLVEQLENLVKKLKKQTKSNGDYTTNVTKTLAQIINTSLDFTIASDNYYELSNIVEAMNDDRGKNNG